MTPAILFRIANNVALIGWLLLILLPRWRPSARLIAPVLIPSVLSMLYVYSLAGHIRGASGGFASLAGVGQLFTNQWLLLAGWVHYLAFDLFLGSWQLREAQELGIAQYLVIPCLVLTFLLGPAGYLLFLVIRVMAVRSRGIRGVNTAVLARATSPVPNE